MPEAQSLANHTKWDPPFHFFYTPVLAANAIYSIVLTVRNFSPGALWLMVVSIAIAVMAFNGRRNALRVQDRLIRLEERLRLSSLLQEPLRSRIPELTESQLISLRFASDSELPALVSTILSKKLA